MTEIYQKRGQWCYRDKNGKLFKFGTYLEAKRSLGVQAPEELEEETNGNEEEEIIVEEESDEEEDWDDYEEEDWDDYEEEEDDSEEEEISTPFVGISKKDS
jgi:hypothetical protein